jgi:hypothetical protein
MRRTLVSLILVAASVAACFHVAQPGAARKSRDVAALAEVLPVLDELRVTNWRDQDWCTDFAYRRGRFLRSDDPDNCNPFGDVAAPFTDAATADFEAVRSAVRASGVSVREIYRPAAVPGQTGFDLIAGSFDRFSYVHEPGFELPDNLENEWVATPRSRLVLRLGRLELIVPNDLATPAGAMRPASKRQRFSLE